MHASTRYDARARAHLLCKAELVRLRRRKLDKRDGAGGAAEAAQVKLGRNSDGHEAVLFEKVHRHLADRAARHDDARARVGDGLDVALQPVLLGAAGAVQGQAQRGLSHRWEQCESVCWYVIPWMQAASFSSSELRG